MLLLLKTAREVTLGLLLWPLKKVISGETERIHRQTADTQDLLRDGRRVQPLL